MQKPITGKEVLEILNSPITKEAKGSFIKIETLETIKQALERLEELEKENQELLVAKGIAIGLKEENTKLKQAIKKIQKLPTCNECDANWHKGCMCLKRKIQEVLEDEKES